MRGSNARRGSTYLHSCGLKVSRPPRFDPVPPALRGHSKIFVRNSHDFEKSDCVDTQG